MKVVGRPSEVMSMEKMMRKCWALFLGNCLVKKFWSEREARNEMNDDEKLRHLNLLTDRWMLWDDVNE